MFSLHTQCFRPEVGLYTVLTARSLVTALDFDHTCALPPKTKVTADVRSFCVFDFWIVLCM